MEKLENVLIRKVRIKDAEALYTLINKSRDNIGKYLPWVDDTNSIMDEELCLNSK